MRGVAASAEAPSPVSVAPIPSFGHVDPHEAIMRERSVNPQLVPSVKGRRAFQVYVGEAKDATVLDVDDVLHRGGQIRDLVALASLVTISAVGQTISNMCNSRRL